MASLLLNKGVLQGYVLTWPPYASNTTEHTTTCWLVWCADTSCRPRETKAYSFLASARGLGYRAMPPYLWSWDHRFLEWNSGSLRPAWRDLHRHLCFGRAVAEALYFCSQKVWNGCGFTLTGVEHIASSKQSPTSCLHVARVFSLKLEVWCTCTV